LEHYTTPHPAQHKYAAVRFLYNRQNSYNPHKQEYDKELNVIHNILHNYSFQILTHKHHPHNMTQQLTQTSSANGPLSHTLAKKHYISPMLSDTQT